jgi:hypothetical protein
VDYFQFHSVTKREFLFREHVNMIHEIRQNISKSDNLSLAIYQR